MAKKYLTDEGIADALYGLLSDYEEDTDEEDEETVLETALDVAQVSDKAQAIDEIAIEPVPHEHQEQIIINIDSCEVQPLDSSSLLSRSETPSEIKMEKKLERAIDTTFHDTSKVSQQFVNSPLVAFMKYMNEDILDKIHFETNLESVQKNKRIGLSREELKVFLGINFMMSYHHLPHIAHYWSGSKDLNVQPIAESMSRDRFQSILTNLHVNDNTKMDPSNKDKLFKIRPLIDHLKQKFIGNRAL